MVVTARIDGYSSQHMLQRLHGVDYNKKVLFPGLALSEMVQFGRVDLSPVLREGLGRVMDELVTQT